MELPLSIRSQPKLVLQAGGCRRFIVSQAGFEFRPRPRGRRSLQPELIVTFSLRVKCDELLSLTRLILGDQPFSKQLVAHLLVGNQFPVVLVEQVQLMSGVSNIGLLFNDKGKREEKNSGIDRHY